MLKRIRSIFLDQEFLRSRIPGKKYLFLAKRILHPSEEWAFDDRKKQIFGLSNKADRKFAFSGKADRKFAFSGRQRPILREHPVFCGTNHTVLAGDHTVDGMVFRRGTIPFSRRILLIPTLPAWGKTPGKPDRDKYFCLNSSPYGI